jgi:putative beta-lysine N-acetyltransferase
MYDRIEKLGRSTIQHGPLNRRIYLLKLHPADMPWIIPLLDRLALQEGYTKIFAKIPAFAADGFEHKGYRREAVVPRFYDDAIDGVFMGKYLERNRAHDPRAAEARKILEAAQRKREPGNRDEPHEPPRTERAAPADVREMSAVYREVFPSYPFPIHDPAYLRDTMDEYVTYFCIRDSGRIVSLSSAEVDRDARNVEMTDFATLPSNRGAGHAIHLLGRMEDEMAHRGIITAYTIARSLSPGMNITFARLDYVFAGSLINNTNISGSIESMNVWYKHLPQQHSDP